MWCNFRNCQSVAWWQNAWSVIDSDSKWKLKRRSFSGQGDEVSRAGILLTFTRRTIAKWFSLIFRVRTGKIRQQVFFLHFFSVPLWKFKFLIRCHHCWHSDQVYQSTLNDAICLAKILRRSHGVIVPGDKRSIWFIDTNGYNILNRSRTRFKVWFSKIYFNTLSRILATPIVSLAP